LRGACLLKVQSLTPADSDWSESRHGDAVELRHGQRADVNAALAELAKGGKKISLGAAKTIVAQARDCCCFSPVSARARLLGL
jgi:hypothetical protein